MKRIPLVAALLAALAAGPARGDSTYGSNRRTDRSDHGPSYHDRYPYNHYYGDHPYPDYDRRHDHHGDRRSDDHWGWRTPRTTPPSTFISPQKEAAP